MASGTGLGDSPGLVLPIYALVVLPLGLYLYHDILDTRWRRVQNLNMYLILYLCLYVLASVAMVVYMVFQRIAADYKEIGASFVALLLASYGFLKLIRLARILRAHKDLVEGPIARCDEVLNVLHPQDKKNRNFEINYRDQPHRHRIPVQSNEIESRSHYLSSVLFDDDFPGSDAARIKWLKLNCTVEVVDEDAEDAAMRIALFMRFALRSAKKELWSVICATHPLVVVTDDRISVGKMLRRLLIGGSGKDSPAHVLRNPVEDMLNDATSMSELGTSLFWIGVEESHEEIAQTLSLFPQRWLRGARQTGFDLIFETSILSILYDHLRDIPARPGFPHEITTFRFSRDTSTLSKLDLGDFTTKLHSSRRDSEENEVAIAVDDDQPQLRRYEDSRVSSESDERLVAARKCTHALVTMFVGNKATQSPSAAGADLKESTYLAISKTFDYATKSQDDASEIFLAAIDELLRTSRLASIVVQTVMGGRFVNELQMRYGPLASLENAEICWGLAAVVEELGWTRSKKSRELLSSWAVKWGLNIKVTDKDNMFSLVRAKIEMTDDPIRRSLRSSAMWMMQKDTDRCPRPDEAFLAYAEMSRYFAEGVLYAFWECAERLSHQRRGRGSSSADDLHLLQLPEKFGVPAELHQNWLRWKETGQGQEKSVRSPYIN